jgi:Flp pilus assembly protein TadG
MKRRWHTLLAAREGVVAMEFAVISGVLMLLTLGTIEISRLLWAQVALDATAIQTARCIGVLSSSCAASGVYSSTNATSYAQTVASGWGITLGNSALTLSSSEASGACAGLSQVSINYTFVTVVPGLLSVLSGGSALTAQACFPNQT